jgi:hypothetical protein
MQSAKKTGTMPRILILPPVDTDGLDTEAKLQLHGIQSVTSASTTDFELRHTSCNSHTQT